MLYDFLSINNVILHSCVKSLGKGVGGGSADGTIPCSYFKWVLVRTCWCSFVAPGLEQVKGTEGSKEPQRSQHTGFIVSLFQPIQRVLFLENHRLHEVRLHLQTRPKPQGHRQGQVHQRTGEFSHIKKKIMNIWNIWLTKNLHCDTKGGWIMYCCDHFFASCFYLIDFYY